MKYAVIGGDERAVQLVKLLVSAGNEVMCLALGKAELPFCSVHTEKIPHCDAVILPLPCEKPAGMLNAPLAERAYSLSEIEKLIPDGVPIVGGKVPPVFQEGSRVFDCMAAPAFTVGNADITAEAAVFMLSERLNKTLYNSRVLVTGYGRIGKLLTAKLKALGCFVTVMSRSKESRAMARAMGISALAPDCDAMELSDFDAVINTAPAQVLTLSDKMRRDCLLIELASAPGGIDEAKALSLGLTVLKAPGLPGKYAPGSAARLIFEFMKECGL